METIALLERKDALKAGSKLFSHIAVKDNGGAPCVEDGLLTFNICKHEIRNSARIGDWLLCIAGVNLQKKGPNRQILWIAKITDIRLMTYYAKHYPTRPDSIYTPDLKLKSDNLFHDVEGNDLAGKNTLFSDHFIYFGTKSIDVPSDMTGIIPGRAYQYKPNEQFKVKLFDKFNEEKKKGMGKRGKHPSASPAPSRCGTAKPTNKSSRTSC